MVTIRLKRIGTKKRPYYRVCIMDSHTARGGRAIEEVGYYHPIENKEQQFVVKEDRVREWVSKGAQPSDTVKKLLNKSKIYV